MSPVPISSGPRVPLMENDNYIQDYRFVIVIRRRGKRAMGIRTTKNEDKAINGYKHDAN